MSARRGRRARDRPFSSRTPVRTLIAKTDSISTSDRREMMAFDPGCRAISVLPVKRSLHPPAIPESTRGRA
jgi:hypothetical protein